MGSNAGQSVDKILHSTVNRLHRHLKLAGGRFVVGFCCVNGKLTLLTFYVINPLMRHL